VTTFWLPSEAASAASARRILDDLPRTREVREVCFFARFVTASLIANAVQHAGLPKDGLIRVHAEEDAERARIQVSHGGRGFDPLRAISRRLDGDRGVGLRFLDAVADRWGYRRDAEEMTIWFEIDLVEGCRPWRGREATSAGQTTGADAAVGNRLLRPRSGTQDEERWTSASGLPGNLCKLAGKRPRSSADRAAVS